MSFERKMYANQVSSIQSLDRKVYANQASMFSFSYFDFKSRYKTSKYAETQKSPKWVSETNILEGLLLLFLTYYTDL